MAYDTDLREEEIKNKLRADYFKEYDSTPILGNIDFAVAVPTQLFETEYLLWAESKKGTQADIYESFVQLILTIGKARTFDKYLPPAFLGAFDAEKIAFIPYNSVLDVFYQNDFNWKVTPSDHSTKEFQQILSTVKETLRQDMLLYHFDTDDKELRRFIRQNFIVGKSELSKIRINKNNFTAIYQKWLKEVKPTIVVDWDKAKSNGIIDADFYLADILSEHNTTLKEKLFVLLRKNYYELDRRIDEMGLLDSKKAPFNDEQRAHQQFWNRYNRPPKREYWDYIVARRDLLVPQDVRERKGSFFTPRCWVELSQEYLAAELGEDWQDEYYVWDCAAGTGNLLAGLTNKYNIWASTLDKADVDVMHDRIRNGANLLDTHVFQFDFLNDPFSKLPQPLQDIIADEEKRKKLVIYINPPYAEAATTKQKTGTGQNKKSVARNNKVYEQYKKIMGGAANELFAQFMMRIYNEIPSCVLANFSTLKNLQAPNFLDFRNNFRAKLGRIFLVPSTTFDNVKGNFPIAFMIWNTAEKELFRSAKADVYNKDGDMLKGKNLYAPIRNRLLMDWLKTCYDKQNQRIAYLRMLGSDIQNNNGVFLTTTPSPSDLKQRKTCNVTRQNLIPICVYLTIRHCIESTWLNDRDQYLFPLDNWKNDKVFQTDCLVYALFCGQNRISSSGGINHWIPFTEEEVDAKEKFDSHFMSDYISGKERAKVEQERSLFDVQKEDNGSSPLVFSEEANDVMNAGRELWRYYHAQPNANPNASFYDIRLHFQGTTVKKNGKEQMNADSTDEHYTELVKTLRRYLRILAKKIEPKVYEYGFLR